MQKPKEPLVPSERHETIRKQMIAILEGRTLSAREISGIVKIGEKEVYEHLEHIQRASRTNNYQLIVTPAECKKCDFVFRKRDRLKKPGKCPVCHSEAITGPLFSIRSNP
ncbi:MAG: transcriptional regulator [Nitrospirae bacterium]|nr:transcriptional regulator [Nitrospirota bacterium]